MKTVQYLEQIRRIDIVTRNKLYDLNVNIKKVKMSIGISAVTYDRERVQTSIHSNPTEAPALLIASMEEETNRAVNRMMHLRHRIVGQIESMQNLDHYDILFRRFVMQESFNQISAAWKYSWNQTKKVYTEALEAFEKQFGSEYLDKKPEYW